MAISDYNKKKKLDVDSVSGTPTVSKAQPIVLLGGQNYSINSATYNNNNFSVGTEDGLPQSIVFNNDGTKIYLGGSSNTTIYEYDLSTAYDITSASYNNNSFDVSSEVSGLAEIAWNNDGTKFYVLGNNNASVYEYDVSTAYDITSASYNNNSFDVSGQESNPQGFDWNNDGTKIYVVGGGSDTVYEYDLSTAYDITSASYNNNSFDVSSELGTSDSLTWGGSGNHLIIMGSNVIYEYDVSTAYDITSASYSNHNFDVSSEDSNMNGTTWDDNGDLLVTVGAGNDNLYEYGIKTDSDTGNGDIIIDFTNIADAQDIAVYDQNGNLLDYEIEDLDTTNETGVLWCYNSWVRDGSTQAQVAYGDNSANTDRQNVTATWGNSGQNALMVQHLEEVIVDETTGNTVTDSTANNNDGTVNGAQIGVSGEFDGAGDFDGTDDYIKGSWNSDISSQITKVAWIRPDTVTTSDSQLDIFDNVVSSGKIDWVTRLDIEDDSTIGWRIRDDEFNNRLDLKGSTLSSDTVYQVGGVYDGSTSYIYLDGSQDASGSISISEFGTLDYYVLGKYKSSTINHFDGWIDAVRMYSSAKSSEWFQADYDASPKAGQVFFSQQAAETTTTTVSATVNDSLAFAETTDTQLIINQLVSDQLSITENIGSTISFTTSDNLAMTENNQGTLSDTLSESLGFNESTTSQLQDTLTDQLNLSENTVGILIDTLTDQITFTENVNATLALTVTVTDSLTFGEQTDGELFDTITEQLGLTENVNSTLINTYADQLNLTEDVQVALAEILSDQLRFTEQTSINLAATLADNLDFSENLESQLIDALTDDLGFTEATATAVAANLTDQLRFTENLEALITLQLADQLDFSEETIGAFSKTLTDQLTFSDQVLFATLLEIDAPTKAIITNVNKFAVMENHVFKEGDRADEVSATLEDENGAIDLSNADSVDIVMQDRAGSTVLDTTATIQNASNGEVTYSWSSGDPIDTAGIYRLEWRINDGSGKQETVPNQGYITIEVEEELG